MKFVEPFLGVASNKGSLWENIRTTSLSYFVIQTTTREGNIRSERIGDFHPFRHSIISERIRAYSCYFQGKYIRVERYYRNDFFFVFSENGNMESILARKSFRINHAEGNKIFSDIIFYGERIFFVARLSISEIPEVRKLVVVEIIAFFSGEIDTAFIHSETRYGFSLLDFRFPEGSLKFYGDYWRMIYGIYFCLYYFCNGSIREMECFLPIIGDISLLKNPKRNGKLTERIMDVSRITFIFGSREIRTTREIPVTGFFWSEYFVFQIQTTICFRTSIVRIESRLDNNNWVEDGN